MQTLVLLTGVLLVTPQWASAWNIPGHMLSAALAHQILQEESPATIDKVKALLAQQPWYSTHWQTFPRRIAGADRDVMLFMLAARWADDIRMVDKAPHRPNLTSVFCPNEALPVGAVLGPSRSSCRA
jgi:hypothetical protein